MHPLPYTWRYALVFWAVFVWAFASEFPIIRKAQKAARDKEKRKQDGRSLVVILALNNVGMLSAFPLATWRATMMRWPFAAFVTGIALLIAGSLLRRHCWRVLGEYFTGNVQARPDQPVVQRGAYRWVRHPSYSGAMLMFVGVGIALGNWVSVAMLLITSIIAYGYRVSVEEKALVETIGAPYADYMKRSKRFVPFVI